MSIQAELRGISAAFELIEQLGQTLIPLPYAQVRASTPTSWLISSAQPLRHHPSSLTLISSPAAQLFRIVTVTYLGLLPFAVVRELRWLTLLLSVRRKPRLALP
jgi:hypothetical protein